MLRRVTRVLVALSMAVTLTSFDGVLLPNTTSAAGSCDFKLGFRAIYHAIPDVVGQCLEDEHFDALNGDALQSTTGGLLVWRKLDNLTAFTDGSRTWVAGPHGLQVRSTDERFPWESGVNPGTSSLSWWNEQARQQAKPVWQAISDSQADFITRNGTPMSLPDIPDDEWGRWSGQASLSVEDLVLTVFYGGAPTDGPLEKAALAEVNHHRSAQGLPAVSLDRRAVLTARAHAAYDVIHHKAYGHDEVAGTTAYVGELPWDRARFFGLEMLKMGENIHGLRGPGAAVGGWMESPPHRSNVLMTTEDWMSPLTMGYAEATMGSHSSSVLVIGSFR